MDDIIIISSTFDDYIVHLEQVFKRLAEFNLTLKPSKCKFASEKVLYLGHVISEKGIEVNPSKVEYHSLYPTILRRSENFWECVITTGNSLKVIHR